MTTDPASDLHAAPGPSVRIAGILAVRFAGASGRAVPWTDDELAEAVRTFAAGRVELLNGHNASDYCAPVVGYLDTLTRSPEGLRFGGVCHDAGVLALLRRRGGMPVSAEYPAKRIGRTVYGHNLFTPARPRPPGYLFAVAILRDEQPAHRQSVVWIDER